MDNVIDLRPESHDISICVNTMCVNKCKRYYEYWKPSARQSYVNPANEYDEMGNQKPCKIRMKEEDIKNG